MLFESIILNAAISTVERLLTLKTHVFEKCCRNVTDNYGKHYHHHHHLKK